MGFLIYGEIISAFPELISATEQEVVRLSDADPSTGEIDFMGFINEALTYFVEVEGWSPIYAFQVLMKQNSEVGLARLRKQSLGEILENPTPEVMMDNIDFFKESYTLVDLEALVDKIGEVLSTYKDPSGLRKMKRDLMLLAKGNN